MMLGTVRIHLVFNSSLCGVRECGAPDIVVQCRRNLELCSNISVIEYRHGSLCEYSLFVVVEYSLSVAKLHFRISEFWSSDRICGRG